MIIFQFCEAISKYCNQEPGPIISLLLDYVGHVKLCSRLLEILNDCSEGTDITRKAGTRNRRSSLRITHEDLSYLLFGQLEDYLKFSSMRSG